MRIGILTLPFNNNYGGYLQAYALMTVLKRMGHDVELIYRRPNKRPFFRRLIYPLKTLVKIILGRPHGSFIMNQESDLRRSGKLLMPFVDKYISPRTKPYYTTTDMEKSCIGKYDVVIVGSDQVWRPMYVPNINDFFLEFIKDKNVRKIAYAASFGTATPEYTDLQKKVCGKLISEFQAISVREKSALKVIENFGWQVNSTPQLVLDPTFLLPSKEYLKHIKVKRCDQIFCYVLDRTERTRELILYAEKLLKLPCYEILKDVGEKTFLKPSIEIWLSNIYNSRFILTDSFHGMVFSIIFNKPFAVYVNKDRGADRFVSLLSLIGLEDRMINDLSDVDKIINNSIKWDRVNEKLEKLRNISIHFLNDSLTSNGTKNNKK